MTRRIAVFTGTRAEYGLLYWVLHELRVRGNDVQLIVTGAHLSADHGMTIKQIEADGVPIAARIDMQLTSDRHIDIVHSMGIGLSGMAKALEQLKPDMVVILGDRYEMLVAATAAAMLQIPIAHLHGGDVTSGAVDDAMRHAITKLSYWHLTATPRYAQRVIQLGEEPERVFVVGESGLDWIARMERLDRNALEKELGIALISPVILFTYHPETLSTFSVEHQIAAVLGALEALPKATLILTGANADAGGRAINEALQRLADGRKNCIFRMSLGSKRYISSMHECDVAVGNSSSGMTEVPALGKASVNIGGRQDGRLRVPSIIDCPCDKDAIVKAIHQALSPEFEKNIAPSNLFGVPGEISSKIAEILSSATIPPIPRKRFYDLP